MGRGISASVKNILAEQSADGSLDYLTSSLEQKLKGVIDLLSRCEEVSEFKFIVPFIEHSD